MKNNNLDINKILKSKNIDSNNDYSFIEQDKELLDNLLFLCLGGSYAYGTNKSDGTSDIDIRGIKMNSKQDILLPNSELEQDINEETDTVIYTINKYIDLLVRCNPNTVEFLGSIDRNALYIHPYFKKTIIDNYKMFLSKVAFSSFAGYSNAQLNRLNNKLGRTNGIIEQQNIIRSIDNASNHIYERYGVNLKTILDINKEDNTLYIIPGKDNLFNFVCNNLSKENAQSFLNELASIFRDYNKLGKRNKSAIEHNKLQKHLMHLFRLTMMGYDILVYQEINTYREKEHDFLMSVRLNNNHEWIAEDNTLTDKAEKYVAEQMKKLENARDISKLPEKVDRSKIDKLIQQINYDIITNNWR